MIPTAAVAVLMMLAGIAGYFLHVWSVRRENRINPFDAYSDPDLKVLRKKTAANASWQWERNRPTAQDSFVLLKKIDREIERRVRQASITEKAERSSIQEFDLVYEEVLRDIKTRETK